MNVARVPEDMWVCQDFERAWSILSQIEPAMMGANIRDCYWLGKIEVRSTPPSLLKLKRLVNVNSILSGRHKASASPEVRIKLDLTTDEKKVEQLLLSERRSLIRSGKERKSIKLWGSLLYLDNQKYGEVRNNKLEVCEQKQQLLRVLHLFHFLTCPQLRPHWEPQGQIQQVIIPQLYPPRSLTCRNN